jgi:hypothetical protein
MQILEPVRPEADTRQQTVQPEAQRMGREQPAFDDARSAALAQRRTKDIIDTSPRLRQMQTVQAMMQDSPRAQAQNQTGMPDRLKSGIESLSGMSMDPVRVHYNSGNPAQLGAHAYAQGHEIHLAPGQEQHLPHEAWHVVQQAQGRVRPTLQMHGGVPVNDDAGLEAEADVMGARALAAGAIAVPQAGLPSIAAGTTAQTVQRVADNRNSFQAYLEEKVPGNPNTKAYRDAMAAAIILDTHQHKVRDPNEPPPEIQNLQKHHYDTSLAPDVYHKILSTYIEGQTSQQLNVVTWGAPVDKGGFRLGTGVTAEFRTGGHAGGNPTAIAVPWMAQALSRRRDARGTLYVMGHLLNADLGGPSLDYNYVPLTGRAGFYGANGANGIHSDMIEQVVKNKVALLGQSVSAITYKVEANYNRLARATEIGALEMARDHMLIIEDELPDVLDAKLMSLPAKTKKELGEMLDANLRSVLNGVNGNNFWRRGWEESFNLVEQNIALWRLEDLIVPQSLNLALAWTQDGAGQRVDFQTPIWLPSSLDAPYEGEPAAGAKKTKKAKPAKKKKGPDQHAAQSRDYLRKVATFGNSVDAWVAAFLMDKQQYEVVQIADVVGNLGRIPALQQKIVDPTTAAAERETLQDEVTVINTQAQSLADGIDGLGRILDSVPHRAKLSELVADVSQGANLAMAPVIALYENGLAQSGPPRTTWETSGKTTYGHERVVVRFAPKGHAEGSSAGGDNEWMSQLEQRRMPGDGSATVYVRGHMINRHLGGPGLDWNMVPLTGRGGWYGANDANAIHSGGIEETVKKLYLRLEAPDSTKPGAVTALAYSVKAVFGDHARGQTLVVQQAVNEFDAIETTARQAHEQDFASKTAGDVGNMFLGLHDKDFAGMLQANPQNALNNLLGILYETYAAEKKYPPGDATADPLRSQIAQDFGLALDVDKLRDAYIKHIVLRKMAMTKVEDAHAMLKWHSYGERWRAPLASHAHLVSAIDSKGLLGPIIAASMGAPDYRTSSMHEIGYRLKANAELWKTEDVAVPLRLEVAARWTQDGIDQERSTTVPNVLPSDVRAPFDPRIEV